MPYLKVMDEKQSQVIFYGVVSFPLGLIGLAGSAIWFFRNRRAGAAEVGSGIVNLGAAILALASLIMLSWSIIVILAYYRAAKEKEEEL